MQSSKQDSKNSSQKSRQTHHSSFVPTAPLPEPISQNIENVIALRTRHEQDVSRHQRIVETVIASFGRPSFLYGILLAVILWIIPNVLPKRLGSPRFDPPPFPWLQFSLTSSSLLLTIGVLIKQNRQEKLAEQRAQLNLQLSLLSEQKIAKLIALLEELRSDLPEVENRYDPEAQTMQEAADPEAVVTALEETLTEELKDLKQAGKSQIHRK